MEGLVDLEKKSFMGFVAKGLSKGIGSVARGAKNLFFGTQPVGRLARGIKEAKQQAILGTAATAAFGTEGSKKLSGGTRMVLNKQGALNMLKGLKFSMKKPKGLTPLKGLSSVGKSSTVNNNIGSKFSRPKSALKIMR